LARDTVADPDQPLRAWLRQYTADHPRWGYRRAYHDARAEGWHINHKKIQRLWCQEGLRVQQRRRRRRVGASTIAAPVADATECGVGSRFSVRCLRAEPSVQDVFDRG